MSRPSTVYPSSSSSDHPLGTTNRASLFPTSQPPQPGSRLHAKQQELQGLKELKEYSARLLFQLETMGSGLEAIKMGEESVAQVMSSWQTVFRGIQVAQASILSKTTTQDPSSNNSLIDGSDDLDNLAGVGTPASTLIPDTLVRIPLDQSASNNDALDGTTIGGPTTGTGAAGKREERSVEG